MGSRLSGAAMSQHCPECRLVPSRYGPNVQPLDCSGCGHEAELARVVALCTHAAEGDCLEAAVRRELSYLGSELLLVQKALAALRAERDVFAVSAQRTATDLHNAGNRILYLEAALAFRAAIGKKCQG